MIRFNFKTKEMMIQGVEPEILAELTMATKMIHKELIANHGKDIADDIIKKSYELTLMTDEEIEAENKKLKKEVLRKLFFGGGRSKCMMAA